MSTKLWTNFSKSEKDYDTQEGLIIEKWRKNIAFCDMIDHELLIEEKEEFIFVLMENN